MEGFEPRLVTKHVTRWDIWTAPNCGQVTYHEVLDWVQAAGFDLREGARPRYNDPDPWGRWGSPRHTVPLPKRDDIRLEEYVT